jgi:hypothetical protein
MEWMSISESNTLHIRSMPVWSLQPIFKVPIHRLTWSQSAAIIFAWFLNSQICFRRELRLWLLATCCELVTKQRIMYLHSARKKERQGRGSCVCSAARSEDDCTVCEVWLVLARSLHPVPVPASLGSYHDTVCSWQHCNSARELCEHGEAGRVGALRSGTVTSGGHC